MTNDLRSILGELYAIDPSLRDHEAELIPVIEAMMRTKPDVTPDPAFVEHLRLTLRDKASNVSYSTSSSFFSFFTMNKLQYTLSGLLIGIIAAAPLTYSLTKSGQSAFAPANPESAQNLFSYSVEETGSNAFGELSTTATDTYGGGDTPVGSPAPTVSRDMMNTRPQSGGGGSDSMMVDPKIGIMPPSEYTEYRLSFEGQLPTLSDSVDVFKRDKGTSAADISKILGAFNTGLIDLRSFAGAKTDMISFYQDTKYGYMGTISFREGSISLNQNWEQWPHPESNCQDEACFQRYRLKAEDIPADDVLIKIAQEFVDAHSIDMSQYGAPEVDHQWRTQYEAASDKSMIWIPDSVRVTYPLMIDGKPVFDEGGMKAGIGIGVNVREKRVSDAWGIMDQKYQKSSYAGVTDESVIREYLSNYGKMDTSWMPPNTPKKTVTVTLGTPTVSLLRVYTYKNNVSEELMVPSLVFPVTNVSDGGYFYNESITIPLASDLLKERNSGGNPVPMPLIMEDAAR